METAAQPLPPLDIVVLDDDADFRQYLEDILKDDGHQVRLCATPDEMWATNAERLPDVVLLDMKMGAVTGEQILDQLRARWPELCVIIITGYPDLDDMRAAFRLRSFDYLTKPFSLSQLREALERAVKTLGLGQNDVERLRERLGQRIKALRAERDWGLKELAAATGISVSQLSSIERGIHLPSLEGLITISRAFHKKPSALLSDIDF
ncbi:MAG TPA: response regulator [Blastocatellia bacterium]|nr:response regulator [Blastocatellia bacterium]